MHFPVAMNDLVDPVSDMGPAHLRPHLSSCKTWHPSNPSMTHPIVDYVTRLHAGGWHA